MVGKIVGLACPSIDGELNINNGQPISIGEIEIWPRPEPDGIWTKLAFDMYIHIDDGCIARQRMDGDD